MSLNGAIAEAVVLIRADGSEFGSDVERQGSAAGVRAGSAFGSQFKRRAKAVVAVGGAAIFAGVTAGLRTGFGELTDYETGLSNLRAGLKSTKGVVGLTSKEMEHLASRIQNYSGQTDDSIVKTEQLLLTFTNIRNEAGKNNDIFSQTTKIAADMAQRMGGDASSAAVQLGKALNDPVKGITALTRVGVAFTEDQKKQIETLVKHGDTLKAQKIILHELNTEFGGSAKLYGHTLPGQLDRTKRAYEDITQELATKVLPYALDFSKWIRKDAIPALEDFGGWVKDHKTELEVFAGILAGAAVSVKAFKGVRSLQALFGRGPLASGGGGLLGTASMARPVPVYVTNNVPGLSRPGAGGAAGGAGFFARLFGAGAEKWLPRAAGVALGVDAARTGIDAVRGHQSGGITGLVGGGLRGAGSALSELGGLGGDLGGFFGNIGGLLGKAGEINKATHDRADAERDAASAAKYDAEQTKALNHLLVDNPGLSRAARDEAAKLAKELHDAGAGARASGRGIGVDFGQGIVEGLHSKDGDVRAAAHYQASLLDKYARLAIDAESPSKVARKVGNDWGDGLVRGLQDRQNAISRQIDIEAGELGSLRSKAQSLASGVTGAILGDSSILNTPDQTVAGIKHYFRHVGQVDKLFKHRLHRLREMHFRNGLINELAEAGPEAAGNLVRQLVGADRHDVRIIDRRYRRTRHVAGLAGQAARQETYDPQIHDVVRELRGLRDDLHNVTAEIRGAEHRKHARTNRP